MAEDVENPRVKVSCVMAAGAIGTPVTHGLGMALLPSQERGLCSRVASASAASDTANLSAGEECVILTPAYTPDLGTGIHCSN